MATIYKGDPFYEEEEFQTFQQPQHFNLNDYPYRGPTQSGYVETGNIIGYPGEAGYDDNLSFERDFRGNKLSDTGVQMAYKTPRTIADQNALKGLTEAAAAEELLANQLNQNYGQFFRNQPVNERNFFTPVKEGLGSLKTNVGQKLGQGWDLAQQLPGMAMSALTGIPGVGLLMNMLPKTSPEQRNFMENIATDPEYQNLVNSIPGMSNYNQIFGMGSGRGLMGAIDKRLATLARTEKRQGVNFSDTLKERRKKLEALRELERQKESEFLESQRRGRRPGTGGGDGGGTADQGGTYGGYSYDSGGREGYGYGLKYGGRVGYANGGLASLFTRRG